MKKFLIRLSLFSSIALVVTGLILVKYGGYIDYFYLKFTTPKQHSFILGDSRSFQGIQPRIVDAALKGEGFELPMFNYSFTITQAAYGPAYTESVKRKMDPDTKNGLFIINVNPWVLAQREKDNFAEGEYMEAEHPPHNMHFVDVNPNFEYVVKNFNYLHIRALFKQNSELHSDGWMEERNLPKDSNTFVGWKQNQYKIYNGFAQRWKKCDHRVNELKKMIEFLQHHGTVVLVRMPVDEKLQQIESNFWPEFDTAIEKVASTTQVAYFNLLKNNKYKTYDGNHIDKFGGVAFTKDLCELIVKHKKNPGIPVCALPKK
ncbi:MAG: hypothetical protein RLZZ500_383 [Bacteroidota bacterium]|jgi:hypothetical protein